MKTVALFLVLFSSALSSALFAQLPNLIAIPGGFSPSSMLRNNLLTVSVTVQNTGSSSSAKSHISFYVSASTNISRGTCIACVSVEPLAAGAKSEIKRITVPLPLSMMLGFYYVGWVVDPYNEVNESDEKNDFYLTGPKLSLGSTSVYDRHITYPIIFIHGLNSNDKIWSNLSYQLDHNGWSYGGKIDYCLNYDGNYKTSVLENDIHDFNKQAPLFQGDYYTVNFDVNPDGTVYNNVVESNEAAIIKQGKALQSAIRHVLDATGADKVILVGHCMGGLAAREYLQNSDNWQSDGQHHVAKLLTIGTPHGGSNDWTYGLEGIADERSEAIRDLLQSYSNGTAGIYLYAGNENQLNNLSFDNNDINCNGINGDNIMGLNKRTIPSDPAYSCIIGTGGSSGGDGFVSQASANLNNFYKLEADTFLVNDTHAGIVKNLLAGIKGLDEPSDFKHAYQISIDTLYFGLISPQSTGSIPVDDGDCYSFNLNTGSKLDINIANIFVSQMSAALYDSSLSKKLIVYSNTLSKIDTSIALSKGKYYLEIKAQPEAYSWTYPYSIKLHSTPVTEIKDGAILPPGKFKLLQNYPNPFNPTTNISFSLPEGQNVKLIIYDMLGKEVSVLVNEYKTAGRYSVLFDAGDLPSGIYIYTIQAGQYRASKHLVILK